MLSTFMDWPMGAFLSKLELKDEKSFIVEKEIDGGI